MQRNALLLTALLAAAIVSLHAQLPDDTHLPLYHGTTTHVDGVFVTPVAGAPFTATVIISSERPMPDGSTESKHTINLIARDSRGRIRNERRPMMPESFKGMPPLIQVHLFDPQTRLNTYYQPSTRIARQTVLPATPKGPNLTDPGITVENLGGTDLNGVEVQGVRRSHTVPAQASGTGAPVFVEDEYWYSEDLQINLLVHHSDPRSGVQTVAVSDIKREEPAASLFEVPEGYKTVDMTPPPGAPVSQRP
jgi:hypothetical protein